MAAPMEENMETEIEKYMKNSPSDNQLVVGNIANGLTDGRIQLISFIESLQKYLTDKDASIRTKCVRLIGEIIHKLPSSQLDEGEVELLSTYMCERLIDHHSVQPAALYTLLALSGCQNFPRGLASKVCRIIFQNVHNQSLSQTDRCSVYTMLSRFLDKNIDELKDMETDFVLGFIQMMDTEKDPRNLLICFQTARTIILNFSLGAFVEEMFEVTSCYFPIDFTPPPNDNYKITREDLIRGLRSCLSATELFAEYAYPLLLEKLTSDVQSAKLDSLQTLCECVEIYGIKYLREYGSSLYNCIKSELFSSGNQAIEDAGLEALKLMVKTLSKSSLEGSDSPEQVFVTEILQDCQRYMTEEDTRLLVPVCRLLASSAEGSDSACCLVLQSVLPKLMDLYNKFFVNTQRKVVLDMINKFVKVVNGYSSGSCHKVFLNYIDELFTLIQAALADSSSHLRYTGVTGVNEMIKANKEQVQVYTELVLDKSFSDEDKEVRKSCLKPLRTVAEISPTILEGSVIPKILQRLANDVQSTDPTETIDLLSTVTIGYRPFMTVSDRLLQIVSEIPLTGNAESNSEQRANTLVNCLCTVIQNNVDDQESFKYMYSILVTKIYTLVIASCKYSGSVILSSSVLQGLCRCVQCISVRCSDSQILELYSVTSKIFLQGNLTDQGINDVDFKPFDLSSLPSQTQLVSLVTPVICCCNEKLPDEEEYVQKLLALSRKSQDRNTQLSASKCLAGLVNKHPDLLQQINLTEIQQNVQNLTQSSEGRRSELPVIIWLTKALVMRGHPTAQSLVMFLMSLLSDPDIGHEVSEGFNIILTDSEEVLNKPMRSVIRMMYKQRLFVENVSVLVKSFEKADQGTRKNYLHVLSSMLRTLPKQVLLNELPPLFPLMIHSLMSDDLELQMSTTDTIYDLAHDAPEIVSTHVDSLVPQLLKLSRNQLSMKLRQSALQCLGVLTVLPTHTVLPYKSQVIRGLEKALDDKKRLVRKEAVTARNEWFLLGTASK